MLVEIRTADDLFGPGSEPGTVPTDLEQSTGLERLEILSKMEGVELFDMTPLDSSRKGMFFFVNVSIHGPWHGAAGGGKKC